MPPEAFDDILDDKVQLLTVSHVYYNTAHRLNLPAVAERCRAHDILFVVDDYQCCGTRPINVHKMGADVLVTERSNTCSARRGSRSSMCARAFSIDYIRRRPDGSGRKTSMTFKSSDTKRRPTPGVFRPARRPFPPYSIVWPGSSSSNQWGSIRSARGSRP